LVTADLIGDRPAFTRVSFAFVIAGMRISPYSVVVIGNHAE
jgi:hypothetical protein